VTARQITQAMMKLTAGTIVNAVSEAELLIVERSTAGSWASAFGMGVLPSAALKDLCFFPPWYFFEV